MSGSPDVPAAEGRRSKALVLLGILLVTDADVLGIEKPHHGSEHGLARERALFQVLFDAPPQARERFAEL